MGWTEIGFDDVELASVIDEPFRMEWLTHMKLYRQYGIPAGAEWFKLVKLTQRDGWCGLNVHLIDENGAPLDHVAACQGWRDGPDNVTAPMGGQPPGYPNRGNCGFTNENGDLGFGWGGGEAFDPTAGEGAHWYWVMGQWCDVPCGFGWWALTNHMTIEPTFQRVMGSEPPPEPPPGDDIIERLDRIEGKLDLLASKLAIGTKALAIALE